jgi:hypothetical protein
LSISLTINGTSYEYPETNDQKWGPDATQWAQAVTNGMLQKAGGLFQLLAEVDFGTTYGLKSVYYKSRTANVAAAGQIRLANADSISFRNLLNDGDLAFKPGSSNAIPQWNSIDLVNLSTAQTLTNKTFTAPIFTGQILADSGSAAAPEYSFSADADTGMYRHSSQNLGFSTAGVLALRINNSQQAVFSGLVTLPNLTSSTANAASAGTIRLANSDTIKFRNAGGGGDISFTVGSTDSLPSYAGIDLVNISSSQTLTNKTLTSPTINGLILTGQISGAVGSAAAPTYSFTGSLGTGAYSPSTDNWGVATGGTLALRINNSQQATFSGLVTVPNLTSSTASAASAGTIRLANTDTIKFRNSLDNADITLGVGSTNSVPAYAGVDLVNLSASQTLTNKTLSGNTAATLISGSGTLTLNTSGTITVPNGTDTLVGKATTDVLTNKTLTGNTAVNLISGSGTLVLNTTGTITVPNGTDTLVGKATSDVLTNKTLTGNTAVNLISGSGTLVLNTTGTMTLPNATDTVVGKATSDVLTNKTISGSSNTLSNIAFASLATLTSGNIIVGNGSNVAASVALSGYGTITNAGVLTITKVQGTATNDNATAGDVGQYIIQSRVESSAASITTATSQNVTASSLDLAAGDWDIDAMICFFPAASTVVTNLFGSISTTSATLSAGDTTAVPTSGQSRVNQAFPAGYVPGSEVTVPLPRTRASISGNTSYYLVARCNFSVSTMQVFGAIWARRVR